MDLVNAIGKVRFASARAQRVHIHKGQHLVADLLCLETGQETVGEAGEWTYYVIKGLARCKGPGGAVDIPAGQSVSVAADEKHSLVATGEQRLICLAVGCKALAV